MTDHYRTYIYYGFAVPFAQFIAEDLGCGPYVQIKTAKCVFINAPHSLKLLSSTHQLIDEEDILQQHVKLSDLVKHNYITEDHFTELPGWTELLI